MPAPGVMGCCQDKVAEETPGPKTRPLKRDGPGVRAARPMADEEKDAPSRRDRRSDDSFLITVLWRRLSMFSRRGSARSAGRHSAVIQRPGDPIQESKHEENQEQPEKG